MSEASADPGKFLQQVGALCWRRTHLVEVLLVTSLRTKRWIIPKGWTQGSMSLAHSAAAEACEEAGVVGEVSKQPIGHFNYLKRKWGIERPCKVDVFSLRVSVEQEKWPEQKKRERIWLPPNMAADRIEEPQLRELMLTFLSSKYRSE
jgi:8-oxo-dGTP pyrophosphatase MutT (NUDIX family)